MATAAAAEACSAARLHGAAREARAARHQPRSRLPCALCAARASDVRGLQHRAVQRGSWMAAMDRWLRRPLPKRARLLGCTAQHVRPARPASSLARACVARCAPPERAICAAYSTVLCSVAAGWQRWIDGYGGCCRSALGCTAARRITCGPPGPPPASLAPVLRVARRPSERYARPTAPCCAAGPARQRRHGHPIQ